VPTRRELNNERRDLRIRNPPIRDGHHGTPSRLKHTPIMQRSELPPAEPREEMIMLILSIAVFVATLATPVVVLALWQHFEAREVRRQVRAIQW
jgi:hypothetical protein